MAERPVKVRCHGQVKRLRMTGNLKNVLNVICQGFGLPDDTVIKLMMIVEGNGTPHHVTEQTLRYNWNGLRELQVTGLPLEAQRAMVNPVHLQTVVDGRAYRIDEPPTLDSRVVQEHRSDLGIMKNITEFKDMFSGTSSLVSDLHHSVSSLRTSVLVNNSNLVSKSKIVVKSLIDIFVKTETAFGGFINFCATVTAVLPQLSLDLVNGDHRAAVASLDMLMSKGDEMGKVARELDCSIGRSMREIDDAIKAIKNEKERIDNKVESTTREKERTEDKVKRQSEEIDRLERKLIEYRNQVAREKIHAIVHGTTTGIGAGMTIVGIAFPPLLIAGVHTLVNSSFHLGVAVDRIIDLRKMINAASDEKGREERRKEELEQKLSELRDDRRKLETIAACLRDIWGKMNKIKLTVERMNSFWPGLKGFYASMMASERQMVVVMETEDSKNPLHESEAFKSQIVNFSARSVALQEVCQSCHDDVRTALLKLRLYQQMF